MKQVTQLRHDLNAKIGLLQIYSQDLESDEDHDRQEEEDAGGGKSKNGKRNSSVLQDWEVLQQKVSSLERDNRQLREEASSRQTDLDQEEKKEMQLISDCVKQLSELTCSFWSLFVQKQYSIQLLSFLPCFVGERNLN